MNIKSLIIALIIIPTFTLKAETISPAEKQELSKGMIKKVEWRKGYIWPEVTIKILLNHSPIDNMNVFLDFEKHKSYIPDMLESKILKKISPNETHVYFEMVMPWPVKKTSHVTNNVVTHNSDGSHTLKWNLVKADMIKATDGYMNFSDYEGKTLLTYVSLIVPNSSFAGMFKNRVATDVEKAVTQISKHLNRTLNKKKDDIISINQKAETQNNL